MTRMSVTTEPCGCKHNGTHYLSECLLHKAESDAIHECARRGISYTGPNMFKAARREIESDLAAWGVGIVQVFPDGTVEHVPAEDWLNLTEEA